uniref:Ceramide synthase 3a n=1 Tax=Neogobius melanostomus TaxID=47308 RepID=A0A8C6SSB7_9GOBI
MSNKGTVAGNSAENPGQTLVIQSSPLLRQSMLGHMYEWFWWDRLWLPVNLTWADLEDREGRVYAKASHLYVTIPFALAFLLVRFMFERWIATPLALAAGVKRRVRVQTEENPILENYYCKLSRKPSQADVSGLSKKSGLSVRQVERWFGGGGSWTGPACSGSSQRRAGGSPFTCVPLAGEFLHFTTKNGSTTLEKYGQAFLNRSVTHILRRYYEKNTCIYVNPHPESVIFSLGLQSMLDSQYWYYILELSFYSSLLLSVAFDIKRKDFREQIVHHCATVVLLSFSWCVNYIRVGTLVMLVHDASDVLLESAKLFNYAKWERTCQGLFVLFAAVFMGTRLVIFPFWLIHCTWVYPPLHYPPFFGYYFFNAALLVLQGLHVFWAYLILRMVNKFLFGKLTGDERSDDEEELSLGEQEEAEELQSQRGGVVHGKLKNGCSELLPPPHVYCPAKTVY